MKKTVLLFLLLLTAANVFSQGTLSGDLMMNLNFFQRDTNIKASNNPLYDNYLSGSEGWLALRYNVSGYTFFLRADAFNNSNLKAPRQANTDFGVGAWSVTKDMNDLSITVGYIYDQVGSGILFKAYEDRGLLIDNALVGIELKYKLTKNIQLKGFTGQIKDNQNSIVNARYGPVIRGFNAEGDFGNNVHVIPGVGVLNRTLDATSMNEVVSQINSMRAASRFEPMYNMYAFCAYNTLTYKNFSWYAEADYKTHEAILEDSLVDKPGNVEFTTLSYGQKGIALNIAGKRTQDFVMRTSPNEFTVGDGILNHQPVIAPVRPERLLARYTPASQDISEQAVNANLLLSPKDVTNIMLSYTSITTLDNQRLYQEGYVEGNYQGLQSWIFQLGAQYLQYNNTVYVGHAASIVNAITPFTEVTYRLSEKKSLRMELQYMNTKQDYGSWIFALLEYDIAPKWAITASDMYNTVMNRNSDNPNSSDVGFSNEKAQNYYNLFVAYTKGANRFSLAYVKQVDGINCSGGVCRYEPAFSGVKATITSSF